MSTQNGRLVTCDRCANFTFLKYVGKGETDGGYTTWDKFEKLPEEWLYTSYFGYLCPDCADEFRAFVTEFMGGKVSPEWKYKDWEGINDGQTN